MNSSIHRPALGKRLNKPGIEVRIAYGRAIPIPITIIATVAGSKGWVCAHAKAAAKIAKLHGVLNTAARKPIPTVPKPVPELDLEATDDGTVIVKTSNINKDSTTSNSAIAVTKAGLRNWSPHCKTVP